MLEVADDGLIKRGIRSDDVIGCCRANTVFASLVLSKSRVEHNVIGGVLAG